jgi:hypothetical protein
VSHRKLDLTVGKLPPVLDGCHVTALRRLVDDFARFAASSVNRQCEYFGFPNAGHSVGQITGANEHVTRSFAILRISVAVPERAALN